jgi:RNA polymerase sigma-70 factor (sigma-E family)
MDTLAREYEQFVRARTHALLRSAYLLTGDQQLAEDLVQEALARTHRAWGRLHESGNAEAYTRKIMYHAQVSAWRRRRVAESFPGTLPEGPGGGDPSGPVTTKLAVQRALGQLSRRQRAVIVLRYFEDRTEVESAERLGVAVGTVKTLCARALQRLRAHGPELMQLLASEGAER